MIGPKVDQALVPVNVWVPIAKEVVAEDSVVFLGSIYDQTFPFEGGKCGKRKCPKDLLLENLHRLRGGIEGKERKRLFKQGRR